MAGVYPGQRVRELGPLGIARNDACAQRTALEGRANGAV